MTTLQRRRTTAEAEETGYRRGYVHGYNEALYNVEGITGRKVSAELWEHVDTLMAWRYGDRDDNETYLPPLISEANK